MAENRSQSSSEQYIKRSNRRLLFGGLLLFVVFLVALAFMSGGNKQRVEETPMEYTNEILDDHQTSLTQPDLFARGDAKLRIEPSQIDMNNVVIGSKVEAILTLTAENTPIEFLGMDLAEQQVDGFTLDSNCSGAPLEAGKSCTVKVFWNPVALRQLQNNLAIRWKEYSQTAFKEQSSIVQIKAQSTDSKDCVICEDIRNKEAIEPRVVMELGGNLYPIDDDGEFVTIDGEKNPITDNDVVLKKDDSGLILGIVEPEYIAVNMNNDVMGTISETKEVIGANGEKIGKMLGDKTIVDTKLNILGAGIPVVSAIDIQGNVIGKITNEGTVVDGKNTVIGRVWVDGQVVSTENKPIGFVRPWGLVADFMGKIIGGIIPDGTVIDAQNSTIGKVLPNGFVVSNENGLIGATIPQGVAVSAGCQALGKVLLNGIVKDTFDQNIGKVMADGSVVNSLGETMGSVVSQGLVIDEKGVVIGFVNSEGKAVNAAGAVIGCVNPDGTIAAGKKMVGVVMPRGHVIGNRCLPVGSVFPNGDVYNSALEKVGRVMPDKYVKNAANDILGIVVTRTTAIAEGCRFLGIVSITGQVMDAQGTIVGCVSPDKTVIDKDGETIGGWSPIGPIYDKDGRFIGRTGYDGKARDKDGKVIGCVNPDGTVVDEKGNIIGQVRTDGGSMVLDANGNPTGSTVIGRTVYDKNGNPIGILNREGIVVSETGKYVGFIPPDGHIFSPDGLILGRYTSQVGYAVNQSNERFGKIMFDLTVVSAETGDIIGGLIADNTGFIDVNGKYLGQVQADGTLRNDKQEVIGAIRGDGSVVDKEGKLIGFKVDEGTVATSRGTVVGTVNKKGIVLSAGKTEIGHIIGNGLAISTDGKKILGGIVPATALAMDATGLVGYLNDKGEIQGLSGEVVGKATPFGLVLSEDGTAIAKLTRLGVFVNKDGRTIGWTSFEGTLTGKNEKPAGKINALGLAFDRSNNLLGSMVKRGLVIDKTGAFVSSVAVNNRILQKDKSLATLTAASYVYDTENVAIGRIVPAGVAITNDGDFLGWMRGDGTIGTNGDALGTILFDNRIINKQGTIIGMYVPLQSVAYDDESKTIGVVGLDGEIVSAIGQKRGRIRGGNLVASGDKIIARLLSDIPYISNDVAGKTNGLAQLNGEVVTAMGGKPVGNLMVNASAANNYQVIGHEAVIGAPITNSMSSLGQLYVNGLSMRNGKKEGVLSGTKAIYNDKGTIVGSVLPVGTIIGKSGNFIGQSAASSQVTGRTGKQAAIQMTHGTALLKDNVWVGGLLPEGVVVNDDAEVLGTITPDGAVLTGDDTVIARALNDGSAARISDRALFNTMPYAGAVITQGLPFGYRGNVIGMTTLNGDVIDTTGNKVFRILDDATILGVEEPLVGAILPFMTAFDHDGNQMGTLNSQGKVVTATGEITGKIAVNETVKGKGEYEILGALVPRRTITNDCKMVGTVAYTGQVVDARGSIVGRMQPDRWAINSAGEKIGRVTRWGIVISNEGNYIGRTLPDSTVVDKEGVSLGCAKNDGSVVDSAGNVIGGVIERGLVLGKDGKPIGRVKADGSIVDKDGNVIGKILADGTAVDAEGNVIGRLVPPDQEILFDENGNIKGTFGADGTFFDPEGNAVFRVDKDGNVYDPKGNLIGKYKDGEFTDVKGNPLGDPTLLVDKDGNVFGIVSGCDVLNSFGEKIASILANGNVVDLNGEVYAKILGDGTIMKGDEVAGKVSGPNPRLDRCGIQTTAAGVGAGDATASASSSAVGRAIYIGNQKYDISEKGSIIDENGTVIGYMGDDGKPYTTDGRVLTASGDAAGRSRPNVFKQPTFSPEQQAQLNDLLTKKRSSMRAGIKNAIKPDGRILAQSKPHRASDWGDMVPKNVSSWPVDMSRMILQDKAIPAVIVRSIDSRYSDVPVSAIVERHIYSEKGRNILIPAGSRVIGKMTGSPGTDKVAKMEISWERLIRPDGGMFKFEAVSGDAQGRGGVAAYLDEQLITKYGKPILTSVVTSSVAYMMAANDDYTSNADTGSTTRSSKSEAVADARENFINAMDTIFQQLVAEATEVPPVVFVPSGTRITIFSKTDLWLRSEEDDVREFEESNGAASTAAQTPEMNSWVDARQGMGEETDEESSSTVTPTSESSNSSKSNDKEEEVVDYYRPDDSYKAASSGGTSSSNTGSNNQSAAIDTPIYDGTQATVTEDIPLKDRTVAPVLPKTGTASRLF